MRRLSKEEKKLLKSLARSGKKALGLMDFVAIGFPKKGKFEISTFQQTISLQVSDQELTQVMNHLVSRLTLIKKLEESGYLNLWNELPIKDNTQACGEASPNSKTVFVPDIHIASELLKYGNYRMQLSDSLVEWSRKNFRTPTLSTGIRYVMYVLLVVVGIDVLYHIQIIGKNIQADHQTIVDNNQEVIKNQKLNNQIIDSLQAQGKDLMLITTRISNNTENMRDIERLVYYQEKSIKSIQNQIHTLERQLNINNALIQRSDSLLNIISSHE